MLPGVRLDSQGDDDIRQKVARGHFLACLFDWWRHNSIKNVSVGFNVLTLLPIIGVLSVGFSIMSLIVIISLLTSLLLRYIADWDDKRVVLSNIFWGKWIRICKISNKHFSGDINIPVRYRGLGWAGAGTRMKNGSPLSRDNLLAAPALTKQL